MHVFNAINWYGNKLLAFIVSLAYELASVAPPKLVCEHDPSVAPPKRVLANSLEVTMR